MEDGMAAMFPNGIRTLLVDDDAKFLKSAKELLSFLNFKVVVCSNVAHALKTLMRGDHHGFDVILVHAAKAAASGFNFRAIIEVNLLIPVIYFLPQGHEATGDKGDKLLRALQVGTYVIKKPVDAKEVRNLLWKVIASRKCQMETKTRRGVQGAEVVKGGSQRHQYEDNTLFPHDALLRGLHGPLSEFDDVVNLDYFLLLGGFTGSSAAAADDDAGTSLNAGEEGGSNMDGLGNLDGLPIPYDLLENFMVPCHQNRNNVRES